MKANGWPSLQGWSDQPGDLRTRRAIYGKVHRAPTDYRWFAWSDGFPKTPAPFEQALVLGGEDAAAVLYCWRHSPEGGDAAIKYYPSRAFDAAGRPAGVEKQVLAAVPGSALPAAALAFLLLPEAAQLDDTVWWDSWRDPRWSSPSYHLSIREDQCPILSLADLDSRFEQGLTLLFDSVTEDSLKEFYAQLLSGASPAILRTHETLLPPLALAALLLPLERELTERISLAGGILSNTFDAKRLTHWSGVVCPAGINTPDTPPAPVEAVAAAFGLVQMLKRGLENKGCLPVQMSLGGSYLLGFLESQERWIAPGKMGGESLQHTGPWPVIRNPAEAAILFKKVDEFLAHVRRMPEDEPARRHLDTKVDLVRALLLVLCPGAKSLQVASLPSTKTIPALYFAGRVESHDWAEFTRYSESEFEKLTWHSLRECSFPSMVQPVIDWLQQCASGSGGEPIMQYAERALRSTSTTSSRATLDLVPAQLKPAD